MSLNDDGIKAGREAAREIYRELNTLGTTVYAVTHARDPRDDSGGKPYDSAGVLARFEAILPRQQAAFDGAMRMMTTDVENHRKKIV